MNTLLKYVKNNRRLLGCGNGILIGNMFITAGHCVTNDLFGFKHEDSKYSLNNRDALVYEVMEEGKETAEGYDIAVFKISEIDSPVCLSDDVPEKGKEYTSISYGMCRDNSDEISQGIDIWSQAKRQYILEHSPDNSYEVITGKATVIDTEGNFFICKMEKPLKEGTSGSPLFDSNGKVVGILTHGSFELATCVFISSKAILRKISEANLRND